MTAANARTDLTDPWARYVTSVTASHDDEKHGPPSANGRDGRVTDRNSQNVTPPEQGEQDVCDAVTDVTDQVRKSGQQPRCACGYPLDTAESRRRGNCNGCFLRSKQPGADL